MNPIQELASRSASLTPRRVIGIDLGTTNSTVAEVTLPVDPAKSAESLCECISLEQITQTGPHYGSLVPSVVAIDGGGMVWIGEGAKRMRSLPMDYNLSPGKNLFQDTKNDMGLRKRYFRAPEEFDHARKVAGHIVRFLAQGARHASGHPVGRTVVTVPASFQLNQRNDTLEATRLAGLDISDYDLLDEPVAAFTDYLFTHAAPGLFSRPANVLVFDFGGGTCDVFMARISPRDADKGLDVMSRSVSRYHRLGGFDLDAAIIHEVLIPALLKENNLGPRHFEWGDRKQLLEPALRGCAEALKEGLCREISQLHLHDAYQSADKTTIMARQMATPVKAGGREYHHYERHYATVRELDRQNLEKLAQTQRGYVCPRMVYIWDTAMGGVIDKRDASGWLRFALCFDAVHKLDVPPDHRRDYWSDLIAGAFFKADPNIRNLSKFRLAYRMWLQTRERMIHPEASDEQRRCVEETQRLLKMGNRKDYLDSDLIHIATYGVEAKDGSRIKVSCLTGDAPETVIMRIRLYKGLLSYVCKLYRQDADAEGFPVDFESSHNGEVFCFDLQGNLVRRIDVANETPALPFLGKEPS